MTESTGNKERGAKSADGDLVDGDQQSERSKNGLTLRAIGETDVMVVRDQGVGSRT